MFTNNFYAYLKSAFCHATTSLSNLQVKDTSGTTRKVYFYNISSVSSIFFGNSASTNMGNYGIHFGDGTEPPTKDDYKLSGNKISVLSETGRSRITTISGDTITLTENMTLQNTSDEAVTVSEIAWISDQYCDSRSVGYFLFDRTLLENPVTIAPGEEGVILYKRSITIPRT